MGVFFFSSRRRHTRSYGDWSSDVCSSDLEPCRGGRRQGSRGPAASPPPRTGTPECPTPRRSAAHTPLLRSEERRVGKECTHRWAPLQQRKHNRQVKNLDRVM